MKFKSLQASIIVHFILALGLVVLFYTEEYSKDFFEVPFDYIEVKKATIGEAPAKPKPPKKATTTSNTATSTATTTTTNTSTDTTNTQSNGTGEGPASEEYEVSEMPVLVSEIKVPYPAASKSKGIQGRVLIDLIIDSSGIVRKATLISGPADDLNQAALTAVKSFRFRSAKKDGKDVAVKIRYAYRFILE